MTISEERKKRVIDLYYNQRKTTREIAKIERMSIRDIYAIIRKQHEKDIEIGCHNGHDRINALIGSVMKLAYHNNHSSLKPH